MIKHIFFCIIVFSLCAEAAAQKTKLQLAFETGTNFNAVYGKGVATDLGDQRHDRHNAGYLRVIFSGHFALKAMMAFDQYRWVYKNLSLENSTGTGLETGDLTRRLNYFNFPLLAEYSWGNKIKLIVDGGIFIGYLMRNTLEKTIKAPTAYTQKTEENDRRSVNMGLSAGGGIQIPLSKTFGLDITVRDNLGLSNIYKAPTGMGKTTIKTNAFTISAGLTFALK